MKSIIVFALCTLLTACGSDNTPTVTSQPIDYFNKPHSVAMVVADQTNNIQAADLVISGVARTAEIVTLDFSIAVTNSGTVSQDVDITISGRDRYNLEAITPIITASILPGETRVISQQQQFIASLLYQVETWTVQSVGPTQQQPIAPVEDTAAPPLPEEFQQPPTDLVIPIATDQSGTIQLLKIEPVENFRTADKVNFTTKFQFQNLSSARINFHWTVNALTATDTLVFSRDLNTAIDMTQLLNLSVSYGEPLTIPEYDSITKWVVTDLVRY